jgi:hypothetical protein
MNMGAFAVVTALQRRPGVGSQIATFAGLGRRDPWLGALMALFLLSLTGIPPLAGFWAKAYVILAAVQAGGWLSALAVLAMLNAAAAAFYYLRVVVYMYMREPAEETAPSSPGLLFRVGLAVTGVARPRDGSQQRRERVPRIGPEFRLRNAGRRPGRSGATVTDRSGLSWPQDRGAVPPQLTGRRTGRSTATARRPGSC